MSTGPRTPADVRAEAKRLYERCVFAWLSAVDPESEPVLDVSLRPPTSAQTIADPGATNRWVTSWKKPEHGWDVTCELRKWTDLGVQNLPVHVRISGGTVLAHAAGTLKDWRMLLARMGLACQRFAVDENDRGLVANAFKANATVIRALGDGEFDRLLRVTGWLFDHPDSGFYLRQLPVEGVDTKWLRHHRKVVKALLGAVRAAAGLSGGDELGLIHEEPARDVMVLDPALRPRVMAEPAGLAARVGSTGPGASTVTSVGGRTTADGQGSIISAQNQSERSGRPLPTIVSTISTQSVRTAGTDAQHFGLRHMRLDVRELSGLWSLDRRRPEQLLVFENRESLLALPDRTGVVAIHGGGFAVDHLRDLPWAAGVPIIYWGDLDTNGFAILNRLRLLRPDTVSVLMDSQTINTYSFLGVKEDRPFRGTVESLKGLNALESAAFQRLWELGSDGFPLRIEQERLPWPHVMEVIDEELAASKRANVSSV